MQTLPQLQPNLRRLLSVHLSRLLCIASACGFLLSEACTQSSERGVFLRVAAEDIPTSAAWLHAMLSIDGTPALDEPRIPLNANEHYSFGIRLDRPLHGELSFSLSAWDTQGCILAATEVRVGLASTDSQVPLTVPLQPWPAQLASCDPQGPAIRAISPAVLDTAGHDSLGRTMPLMLTGWGFRDGMQVRLGAQLQMSYRLLSASRLQIDTPLVVQPPGNKPVTLLNSSQHEYVSQPLLLLQMAPGVLRDVSPSFFAGSNREIDFAVGDITGDGLPDLVTMDQQGAVKRATNLGNYTFGALAGIATVPLGPTDVARILLPDANRDGRLDILLVTTAGSSLLINQSNGSFILTAQEPSLASRTAALFDLNADGQPDLILGGATMKNTPSAAFPYEYDLSFPALPDDGTVDALAIADFAGDARPDIAGTTSLGDVVILETQTGRLGLAATYGLRRACRQYPPSLAAADLDRDGDIDLVVNGSSLILLRETLDFSARAISGAAPCYGGNAVTISDANGDSAPDLIYYRDGFVDILYNGGSASFSGKFTSSYIAKLASAFFSGQPRHVDISDINGTKTMAILIGPNILSY